MLSYRHSYHAGNYADVLKHLVQVAILDYLLQKESPLCYHDTHAGAGLYSSSSEQALKTAEYEDGIAKIWHSDSESALIQRYLTLIRSLNPEQQLQFYPGSPKIAALMLRATDTIQATELHPSDFPILQSQFSHRRFSRIENIDAFTGLKAMLPPLNKRGLVLIDPPYELSTEYQDVIKGVTEAYRRFPQGCYAIWYPVIERDAIEAFINGLVRTGIKKQLRIEFCRSADCKGFGMTGSGMLVINPPYTLSALFEQTLPELQRLLGQDGCHWQVSQLVGE